MDLTVQNCGNLAKLECDLNQKIVLQRKNLQGLELIALYESWDPYCTIYKNGTLKGGIFHDILEDLAMSLNFTTK